MKSMRSKLAIDEHVVSKGVRPPTVHRSSLPLCDFLRSSFWAELGNDGSRPKADVEKIGKAATCSC